MQEPNLQSERKRQSPAKAANMSPLPRPRFPAHLPWRHLELAGVVLAMGMGTVWQAALAGTPPPSLEGTPPPVLSADTADGSSAPSNDVVPFVLRVLDPGQRLKGRSPRVIIDNGRTQKTLVPRDNGSPPDTLANDDSYAIGVSDLPGSTFKVTLKTDDNDATIHGEGQVTFSPKNTERNLVVLIGKTGPVFGTNDEELILKQKNLLESATSTRAKAQATRSLGAGSTGTSTRGVFFWALVFGLGGGMLGASLYQAHTWWRAGRGLVRVGLGRAVHPLGRSLPGSDTPSFWKTSLDTWADLTATLAEGLTDRGAVLVVPAPANRDRLEAAFAPRAVPIWFPATHRPSPGTVVACVRRLGALGWLVTLVVEGVDALEEAHPDAPFAALEDLLATSPVPVFVVVPENAPLPETDWPSAHVTRGADGAWTTVAGQETLPASPSE